jgi:hypothetical protein
LQGLLGGGVGGGEVGQLAAGDDVHRSVMIFAFCEMRVKFQCEQVQSLVRTD